ncbi:MAG: 6-phosphogluconolactonase, eukaryotic type [Chitinophagaceae bacterium]|nr:6-phosphogluconolactonase, eukaryotic type [Chitinophagaceae bacterium]
MHLHIYKDADETTFALADWITTLIRKTVEVKDRFTIALSGGETPKKLYQTLASDAYREKINWNRLHIFWGDERYVPFNDERNNAKMAYDNLLGKVNIPPEQVHKIWTDITPEESAKQYEKILHQYFDDRQTTFDLVLLGMGEDGHTLSLFPGSEILDDNNTWVNSVLSKEKGERITLMPAVVNRSAAIVFLVTGKSKAKILQEVLQENKKENYPAQLIHPVNNELHWFVDEEAIKKAE